MSINSKLVTFAQQELVLSRNEIEREKIKVSLLQLEKVLKDKLGSNIKEFIRFGSFTRNTILPRKYDRLSDVDLMVVFNTDSGVKTSGTYRKYLQDIVSVAYPLSISRKDFPVIKLELNHIMFDLVPAYCDEGWGKTYYIPDSSDGWRRSIPNDLNSDLSTMNQSYGDNIVRNTIRLCKCWNAGAGYPFESYLMEKEIISILFLWGDNLYDKFISVLDRIAGNRPGVRQAIDYIKKYKGDMWNSPNEQKQFEWLQRLLPGLK
jgi:predicted nucleotidyltransferase